MQLPEIVYGSPDSSVSREISKLVKSKKLRRILPKVYTSNFEESDEKIIKRNLWQLLANIFPEHLLSHRSALEFQPSPNDNLYLTGNNRRVHEWPGITIRIAKGPAPLEDDNPLYEELYASSLERACLENLSPSRTIDGEKRNVEQAIIEERLLDILNAQGEDALNQLRDRAKVIASQLDWEKEFDRLNRIIGSILATRPSKILKSPVARAKAFGEPYDPSRVLLFQRLVASLKQTTFPERPQKTNSSESFENFAFFESYFSNYIEGTTFLVEEAKAILLENKIIPNRSSDSHDILGTYQICCNPVEMRRTPQSPESLVELLRERHAIVMKGRPDKNPGSFKTKANRAGSTHFVAPDLVRGTLKEGFKLISVLTNPIARAIYMMFFISEVHPFDDGNGRIARVMMNAELGYGEVSKLIIPTVYRDDYILNLKKITKTSDGFSFIRMMDRAHAFSHWLNPENFDNLYQQLQASNAFKESSEAVLRFED